MGIPSYFSYIVKNHSAIIKKYKPNLIKVNNLYLDCNSIIYDIVNNPDFTKIMNSDTINVIISAVLVKIEEYIRVIKPDGIVFIAFDGVAPVAKLNQQRERRYKSLYQTQISKSIFKDSKPDPWNTSAITPGTEFMSKLNQRLKLFFLGPLKYEIKKIILSGSDEYGEGEHKIFDYMRKNPEYHKKSVTVIYGLDADLIMLSINHLHISSHIYLFRETPHFIQSINSELEPNENYLLDIPELAVTITNEMNNNDSSEANPSLPINRIYDYIFICFFLGNDFMPHFPSINIRTGGVDKMSNAYKATIGKTKETLIDRTKINWKNVRKLVDFLAALEEEHLIQEMKLRKKRERKQSHSNDPKIIFESFNSIPIQERDTEKYINPPDPNWEYRYYKSLFGIEINDEIKKQICMNYLEGLEWTLKYYTEGCADWRWSYKYHYPPLLKDLIHYIPYFSTELVPIKPPTPVNELVQLCYVLPKQSLLLLPPKLYDVLTKTHSQWYKSDCNFIWAFCRYFWESHVELPEISIEELEKCINSMYNQ